MKKEHILAVLNSMPLPEVVKWFNHRFIETMTEKDYIFDLDNEDERERCLELFVQSCKNDLRKIQTRLNEAARIDRFVFVCYDIAMLIPLTHVRDITNIFEQLLEQELTGLSYDEIFNN